MPNKEFQPPSAESDRLVREEMAVRLVIDFLAANAPQRERELINRSSAVELACNLLDARPGAADAFLREAGAFADHPDFLKLLRSAERSMFRFIKKGNKEDVEFFLANARPEDYKFWPGLETARFIAQQRLGLLK